jgi:hypothetical protein
MIHQLHTAEVAKTACIALRPSHQQAHVDTDQQWRIDRAAVEAGSPQYCLLHGNPVIVIAKQNQLAVIIPVNVPVGCDVINGGAVCFTGMRGTVYRLQ